MKRIYFVFLAFIGIANAADYPSNVRVEVIDDFSGGLNTAVPAQKLDKKYSPNMRNIFTHRKPRKLVKRNGFILVGSTSSLMDGRTGFTFYHNDGSKEFLVSDSSFLLSTQDFQTYVFVSSGLNTNAMLQFAQMNNKVYCTNGVDAVFTWDTNKNKQILNGTKGLPNVPKGRYISSYMNRIFVGNTSGDNTSLDWSAVVSTEGRILTPDDFLAWPGANHKSIGSTDGESLNALWIQRGQLQMGKSGSIWTLFGDRDSNYIERKIEGQAGVASQDAVVLLDGVAYYKSFNGIYQYNTGFSQRISDLIQPDEALMINPNTRIVQENWDTQADFAKGYIYGTTVTVDGNVTMISKKQGNLTLTALDNPDLNDGQYVLTDGTLSGNDDPPSLTNATTFYGFEQLKFGGSANSSLDYYTKLWLRQIALPYGPVGGCNVNFASVTIWNRNTQEMIKTVGYLYPAGSRLQAVFSSNTIMDGYDLLNSSLAIKIEGCGFDISPINSGWFMQFINSTTGQYISDISTAVSITSWGNFDSIRNTNKGSINYFFRSATSPVNVTTQTWQSISPGTIINANTNNLFKQWATTITATTFMSSITTIFDRGFYYESTPTIDNVQISYIVGSGAANRPVGIAWNNEYWLSVSTNLASNLRLQYVKSWITNPNPNSWDVMAQMNMGSLFKDGTNTFYGGSTNSGSFYRLDYGTNDNGTAIDAFYDTPEMNFTGLIGDEHASNWQDKQLTERWIDIDPETGNTLLLGTSLNGGTMVEKSISVNGTNSFVYVDYSPTTYSRSFRFRIRSKVLDKGLNFNGLGVVYAPLGSRGN